MREHISCEMPAAAQRTPDLGLCPAFLGAHLSGQVVSRRVGRCHGRGSLAATLITTQLHVLEDRQVHQGPFISSHSY